jgi:hypothetical protein
LGYTKLEKECASLRTAAETLSQEKTEAVAARVTKFEDYRVRHRKKLHGFQINLEKVVNEFGVKCLPYPGENNTIGEVVGLFDEENKALPTAIAKENKNSVYYCLVGILQMLYEIGCGHVEGLQAVMASCDASILEDLLDEIAKLTGRIVKKWWTEHGLPHVTDRFRITPVAVFLHCVDVRFLFL